MQDNKEIPIFEDIKDIKDSIKHFDDLQIAGTVYMVFLALYPLLAPQSLLANKIITLIVLVLMLVVCFMGVRIIRRKERLYVTQQIKLIKQSNDFVYVVMNSLNPESANVNYRKFDEALQDFLQDKKDGKKREVRVIAFDKVDESRIQGALDIHKRGIAIKFSPEASHDKLRYTLTDTGMVASIDDRNNKKLSKKWEFVNIKQIQEKHKEEFEKIWESATPFSKYYHKYEPDAEHLEPKSDIAEVVETATQN